MNVSASPSSSLAVLIRLLRGSVGAWGKAGWLSLPLVLLLYRRLGEIGRRMEGLASRFAAGRVWRRKVRVVEASADRKIVRRAVGTRIWPRRFGWLVRAAAWQAAGFGSQLRAVLETPEMVALLEASPQAGRVLLPLCRMLAVETSLLRPERAVVVGEAAVGEKPKRVRTPRETPHLGRVPIPRGVMSAVRRGRYAMG
jgi:hypothetical protein